MKITFDRYADLVFKCDNAMREHMLAKQRVSRDPNAETAAELKAAEVGLLDCQDYDLMRKRMIFWGLNENDLSLMGLQAIEAKGASVRDAVRIHEIRY